MKNQQSLFTLYTHPLSAHGRKVLALTYHLQLEPEIKFVNVYSGEGQSAEYLKINPLGKIPTLVDADFILWESNAILQYIAEKFGDNQLYTKDPQKRADIARWLFWETSHWQPAIGVVLAPAVGHRLLPDVVPAPTSEPHWENAELHRWLTFLDSHLGRQNFLVENELTIADFAVAGMMTYFRFAKFPFDQFPAMSAWYENIEKLEAWKKSESELWAT